LATFLRRRLEKRNKRRSNLKRIAPLRRSLRQTSLKGKFPLEKFDLKDPVMLF
jgi:hypothetical protein